MTLFAQSNYTEGYIVKSKDTIRGFVDDRNDARNARYISFRKTSKDKPEKFKPADINGYYSSSGKYYYSVKVSVRDMNNILYEKVVFIQRLVEGKLNLYYYKEKNLTEHFYLQKDTSGLVELSNEEKIVTVGGKKYSLESKKYLKTLEEFLNDCADLRLKGQLWAFDESEFEKIVTIYNHCGDSVNVGKDIGKIDKKYKTQVHITGVAGINVSSIFSDDKLFNTVFDRKKLGFSGGVGFNINFYRVPKSISLQLDLNYNQKGASSSKVDYKINPGYLDIGALLKYTYPKGPVRPFLAAGPLYGIRISKEKTLDIFKGSPFLGYEGGYCFEAGIFMPVDRISLIVRFERGLIVTNNFSNYFNQSWQFKVGYSFR